MNSKKNKLDVIEYIDEYLSKEKKTFIQRRSSGQKAMFQIKASKFSHNHFNSCIIACNNCIISLRYAPIVAKKRGDKTHTEKLRCNRTFRRKRKF